MMHKLTGIALFIVLYIMTLLFLDHEMNPSEDRIIWTADSTVNRGLFERAYPIIEKTDYSSDLHCGIELFGYADSCVAKTYVDRHKSWIKPEKDIDDENRLMRFWRGRLMITDWGTHRVNSLIEQNNLTFDEAILVRDSVIDIAAMIYDQYSLITNFGSNPDLQKYWEYKIDSMIAVEQKLEVADEFSGASAFFPSNPQQLENTEGYTVVNQYKLDKYGVRFLLSTTYDAFPDTSQIIESIVGQMEEMNLKDINYKVRSEVHGESVILSGINEETGQKYHEKYIIGKEYLYHLKFRHPTDIHDDSVYKILKSNFFNSFETNLNERYWIDLYQNNDFAEVKDANPDKNSNTNLIKFISGDDIDYYLFYHQPFIYKDSLYIPLKCVDNEDFETLDRVLLMINGEKYFSKEADDYDSQIIKVSADELDTGENILKFGFLVKIREEDDYYYFLSTKLTYAHKAEEPSVHE